MKIVLTSVIPCCCFFLLATDFVDSMDEANYIAVALEKPMGIVFEENDSKFGGIFVASLTEGGNAAKNGVLKVGDQLVCVGDKNVCGLDFDDALGAILDSPDDQTKLSWHDSFLDGRVTIHFFSGGFDASSQSSVEETNPSTMCQTLARFIV